MSETWKLRLKQDIRDLYKEPVEGVDVIIDDKDISVMCLVLTPPKGSPYYGLRLHFSVKIHTSYPMSPPKITVDTIVTHPNVFEDGYLCADIIKAESELNWARSNGYKGGYSPAYLLKNIFMNLLSFFASEHIEQDGGYMARTDMTQHNKISKKAVARFTCTKCKFNLQCGLQGVYKPSDDGDDSSTVETAGVVATTDSTRPTQAVTLDRLPEEIWLLIANMLWDQSMFCLGKVYPRFSTIARKYNLLIRRSLVCFYLRKPFTEAVLGIGLKFIANGHKIEIKPCEFELFSYEAFDRCELRKGVWNEDFTHFLPVALSTDHFERALPTIRSSLVRFVGNRNVFTPDVILQALPKMCNQMVLNLMEACSTSSTTATSGNTRLRASEKALTGYYLLLHLTQVLIGAHPALQSQLTQRVDDFVTSPNSRGKLAVPDLGEFLIQIMLDKTVMSDPCAWRDRLSVPFLHEFLSRLVVWQLDPSKGNRPYLAYLDPTDKPSLFYMRESFVASLTSFKLVMFQVAFLKLVRAHPPSYDRYGYPPDFLSEQLLRVVREIDDLSMRMTILSLDKQDPANVTNAWRGFLTALDVPVPADKSDDGFACFVTSSLKRAIDDSQRSGYHICSYTPKELYWLRAQVEPVTPPPLGWHDGGLEETKITKGGNLPVMSFFPHAMKRNLEVRHSYEQRVRYLVSDWSQEYKRHHENERYMDGEYRGEERRKRNRDEGSRESYRDEGHGKRYRDEERHHRERRRDSDRDRNGSYSYRGDRDWERERGGDRYGYRYRPRSLCSYRGERHRDSRDDRNEHRDGDGRYSRRRAYDSYRGEAWRY